MPSDLNQLIFFVIARIISDPVALEAFGSNMDNSWRAYINWRVTPFSSAESG
jgi:hypothetical protein